MATFAQIVNILMDNNATAENASRTDQTDQIIRKNGLAISVCISSDITQIANVSDFVGGSTMIKLFRIRTRLIILLSAAAPLSNVM